MHAHWHDSTVEAILRVPAIAGMTPYRGDVLRGADGLPVVDDSIAILGTDERRRMLETLDSAKRPGTRQKAGREPALLFGLIRCGTCDGTMYRATTNVKYRAYRCQRKGCSKPVNINRGGVEDLVVKLVLDKVGAKPVVTAVRTYDGDDAVLLADIEESIRNTTAAMALDGADMEALSRRLNNLKQARSEARTGVERTPQYRVSARTFAQMWESAKGVEDQRQLLLGQLEAVRIGVGGGHGQTFDPSRVTLRWRRLDPAEEERRQRMEDLLYMRFDRVNGAALPAPT